MLFVFYLQSIAAPMLIPTSVFSRGGSIAHLSLGCKGFWLVFVTAFIGLEKVNLRSIRSIAKIFGTIICVDGAMSMGLLKGQRLVGMEIPTKTTVPICMNFLDPLSVTTWTCFLSVFQSATVTFYLESNMSAWKITSVTSSNFSFWSLDPILPTILTSSVALILDFLKKHENERAIFGTVVNLYLQTWCVAVRGPLYCAMFNPLTTVITAILAFIFLQEGLYLGRCSCSCMWLVYRTLWGKVEDFESNHVSSDQMDHVDDLMSSVEEHLNVNEIDINEPLLPRVKK
ncbi:WAT1-related protein At4g30420 [Dendrobium catenatum]|uniref:WAT1-related protein At4g30420 n=1 Tax=Dendrobium catenatum TaxID=906689 RepID=UPI0010A01D21|nr:WAT1-related protein At4g30420 [Dendrobium catenatum]